MKHWLLIQAGFLIGFWVSPTCADIYVWTDENGVKKFTNYSPPDRASIYMLEPKIASIAAPVVQRSEPDRLQEAEKKIDDLNQEVNDLKRQLEKQRQSNDTSRPPDETEPSEEEGVTEYDPDVSSEEYDQFCCNGYSYSRTYIIYGYSCYRPRRHFIKNHYGFYYPKKYTYRHNQKQYRHFKSHRHPKYRRHYGKHRIVHERQGQLIKRHRSSPHAGFRMRFRRRR